MKKLTIQVTEGQSVSGLLQVPNHATAFYVVAHGAGAGMTHLFMEVMAAGLYDRQIATLRYQFPFMEKGSKRPDVPALAHATVRAAVAEATRQLPTLPLIVGGKSFGGRMSSQAQSETPLANVAGLAFLGFPLHPAGKPSDTRAEHLAQVHVPMLFLQGTRDTLANLPLLRPMVEKLGADATLVEIEGGDHSFKTLVSSGRTDADAMNQSLDAMAAWVSVIVQRSLN